MPKKAEQQIKAQGGASRYRTIKSGDKTMTCAITKKKGPKGGKTVCWPKHVKEGRDDISTLPIPASAKAYARRTGLAAMKRQPKEFQKVNAELLNPGKPDKVKNYEVGRTTDGKRLGAQKLKTEALANRIVSMMLV